MDFTIKILTLYKNLIYQIKKDEHTDEGESLFVYTTGINQQDLNPQRQFFLLDKKFLGYALRPDFFEDGELLKNQNCLFAGHYLFLQGVLEQDDDKQREALFAEAAEELHLELLWQELKPANREIFLRFVSEDDKQVFQLFRPILA